MPEWGSRLGKRLACCQLFRAPPGLGRAPIALLASLSWVVRTRLTNAITKRGCNAVNIGPHR
jgi:hypothetical protein